jgi:hypothetical protein
MQTVEYRLVTILNNELYQTIYRNNTLVKFIRDKRADQILRLPVVDNVGFMIAEEMEESL